MTSVERYQLCAFVFDDGSVARFRPYGWATAGQIAINAPIRARQIIVQSHNDFQVWDMLLPSYIMQTAKPPPVVGHYEDLDQAIMAVAIGKA